MDARDFYLFHPQRIFWIGIGVLGFGSALTLPLWYALYFNDPPQRVSVEERRESEKSPPLSGFTALNEQVPVLAMPDLQSEMTFSFDPPRPDSPELSQQVLVRLKKSALSKRESLPCRLNLHYQGEHLVFADAPSSFWIEIREKEGKIEGNGFVRLPSGEEVAVARFATPPQECPIQTAQEFGDGSPFRHLAEARWLGKDLFKEYNSPGDFFFPLGPPKAEGPERIDLGTGGGLVELKGEEWLVWRQNRWEKIANLSEGAHAPIARIQEKSGKGLVLEGWDLHNHIRLSLSPSPFSNAKVKGEDLFSAVRIRSEKQISCMLEKQCLVLKAGDWVLKTGGRWRVLRRKDERESFLNGKLVGDLFVFEQISLKGGQKTVQGRFFNMGRTSMTPIELAAQTAMKTHVSGRGKAR